MKRVIALAVTIGFVVSGFTVAQQSNLPYVDIEAANQEISSLQENSQKRTQQSEELVQENDNLSGEIQRDQQSLVEIDPVLARLEGELTELFTVNRTIIDDQMKERSQAAIGRARTIKADLQRQMRVLTGRIQGNREQIEEHRERIRINRRRIGENEERIMFLEAAIAQTQAQQQRLDGFITNLDSILNEAEQFVEEPAEGTDENSDE